MRIILLISWVVCASAQSEIEVPSIGTIVDSSGAVRSVYGVAGNFWLGPATEQAGTQPVRSRPVLRLTDGILFATREHLVLRHRDGSEVTFELTGVISIAPLGTHYAAIRAGDSVYLLRIESGRESLYVLPGGSP